MGFWQFVAGNVLAGSVVALVVALIALFLTGRYAAQREDAQLRQARDLASAAALYRVHGQFFKAWKAWDYHSRPIVPFGYAPCPPEAQRHSEILADAAAAEGDYESLVVRISLEHDLAVEEQAAMWCLRFALKQLRYAIRVNKPFHRWRGDTHGRQGLDGGFREYQAFKTLIPIVASILVEGDRGGPGADRGTRSAALREVTGSGETFTCHPPVCRAH